MYNNVIRLSEQLSENHIIVKSECTTAEDILHDMVHSLSDELTPETCEDIFESVLNREKMKSTGIGYNVAVPHTRTSLIKKLYCIIATTKNGIDFKTMDGKPVNLIFLVISPEFTVGPHLNIVSSICHLVGKNADISSELSTVETPDELMQILKEKEEKYLV